MAELGHFVCELAKDEDVVQTNLLRNLDIGAVHGSDDERTVHRKLHVGRAGRLCTGRADVLRQLRACAPKGNIFSLALGQGFQTA